MLDDEKGRISLLLSDLPAVIAFDDGGDRLALGIAYDLRSDGMRIGISFNQVVPGAAMPGWRREGEGTFALADAGEE